MGSAISLRDDFDSAALRRFAKATKDTAQSHRTGLPAFGLEYGHDRMTIDRHQQTAVPPSMKVPPHRRRPRKVVRQQRPEAIYRIASTTSRICVVPPVWATAGRARPTPTPRRCNPLPSASLAVHSAAGWFQSRP